MKCHNGGKRTQKGYKNRAAGGIRQLLLTNPLNSQLATNILCEGVAKKWICLSPQSVLYI